MNPVVALVFCVLNLVLVSTPGPGQPTALEGSGSSESRAKSGLDFGVGFQIIHDSEISFRIGVLDVEELVLQCIFKMHSETVALTLVRPMLLKLLWRSLRFQDRPPNPDPTYC